MRHPLRLLLYIEWILFAGLMVTEVSPHTLQVNGLMWTNIGTIVWLAILGLWLPVGEKLAIKILYTLVEILPIVAAGMMGMRPVGLLYIIVAIRSYLVFGRQYRLWITGGIFTIALIAANLRPIDKHLSARRVNHRPTSIESQAPDRGFRWGFVVMFGGILLSLQLLLDRMLAEKQAKDELAIANARIRNYALKAEELATLQERNRIAREIHDSLGHSLTTLNLYLEMSLKLAQIQPERAQQSLTEAKRLGSIALQDVRQSVAALRSAPFPSQNLPIALQKLVDEFEHSNQIPCTCKLDLPPQLSTEIATALYRIIQEALTNISKYARASRVSTIIEFDTKYLRLTIDDDGCGFDPQPDRAGFGIQGMRERVIALNGQFELISAPHQGCQILATIPLG